jgi:hypothetical protein
MSKSQELCWCGRFAIGICAECQQGVCDVHAVNRHPDGMLIHSQHQQERKEAEAAARLRSQHEEAQEAARLREVRQDVLDRILPQFLKEMARIGNPESIVLKRTRGHSGPRRHLNDNLFSPPPRAWIIRQWNET